MIEIFAHRGFWKDIKEQNTIVAFERAFENNFGVEFDLRDICGEIIISHDFPCGNEISFENLLQALDGRNLPLAINIKADGLGFKIKSLLKKYNHSNYFTFDMSIPDMVCQNKLDLKFYTGLSDIIKEPIMYEEACGIWLDSFLNDWFDKNDIIKILKDNKKLCIVSPELHNRTHYNVWEKYKNIEGISLCTDFPIEAKNFFNE